MPLDAEEQVEVAQRVPAKRGRVWLWVIVALLALGGAAGGAFMLGSRKAAAPKAKPAKAAAVEHKQEFYLALEPAFVVNFRDDASLRYLQIGVTLMAHDQSALDTAKDAAPVIRNDLLMLFSGEDYASLNAPEGKEKLQAKALETVRKIIAERSGKPGIEAVYFTSFVMQ